MEDINWKERLFLIIPRAGNVVIKTGKDWIEYQDIRTKKTRIIIDVNPIGISIGDQVKKVDYCKSSDKIINVEIEHKSTNIIRLIGKLLRIERKTKLFKIDLTKYDIT